MGVTSPLDSSWRTDVQAAQVAPMLPLQLLAQEIGEALGDDGWAHLPRAVPPLR